MPRVLIVTDGLLSLKEPSVLSGIRKQFLLHTTSEAPWFDLSLKAQAIERVLPARVHRALASVMRSDSVATMNALSSDEINLGAPELTEVVLMTLLHQAGLEYEATTYSELSADKKAADALLRRCDCVFASSTMLNGLPEVRAIANLVKRPHNKVVLGGALAGVLHAEWPGVPGIDLLAVGYGEWLVPSLAQWITSGFQEISAPARGRLVQRGGTPVLYSGVPADKNLDFLATPDWKLAEKYHGRTFEMVHYESVRGCPYRCQFCNYPYLFDDTKFRYKSAEKIASDWASYAAQGARYINCLDSLFTIPPKRLVALCERLIELDLDLKWICYARADDLAHGDTALLMRRAGCIQVQIGVESGDAQILANMDKRVSVETNRLAIRRCQEVGLSTLCSVIIGYPGETRETVEKTLRLLQEAKPDFFYAAPFSAQVDHIPVMSPENREKYGLQVSAESSATRYWRHNTMDCAEVIALTRDFNTAMIEAEASLDGSMFYHCIARYERDAHRRDLLAFQKAASGPGLTRALFSRLGAFAQKRLEHDLDPVLASSTPPPPAPLALPVLQNPR